MNILIFKVSFVLRKTVVRGLSFKYISINVAAFLLVSIAFPTLGLLHEWLCLQWSLQVIVPEGGFNNLLHKIFERVVWCVLTKKELAKQCHKRLLYLGLRAATAGRPAPAITTKHPAKSIPGVQPPASCDPLLGKMAIFCWICSSRFAPAILPGLEDWRNRSKVAWVFRVCSVNHTNIKKYIYIYYINSTYVLLHTHIYICIVI